MRRPPRYKDMRMRENVTGFYSGAAKDAEKPPRRGRGTSRLGFFMDFYKKIVVGYCIFADNVV